MLWVCPPLIITQDELKHGLDIIEEGLKLVPVAAEQELAHARS